MGKIYRYILGDFFRTLITYFGILFFLVSIIYLVRIAGYTSVMTMSLADMIQLYFYFLPQIVIYTFPVTFFVALVISLNNFSKDGEMLVLFSLGKPPKSLINLYLLLSFLISLLLIVNSLVLMPLSEQASDNFLEIKKVESKINIRSSEVGQKIDSWHIFTQKANEFEYNDIVLFSKKYKNNEQIIFAKSAKFNSSHNSVSLVLKDGNHFVLYDDTFVQTKYKQLSLVNALRHKKLDDKQIVLYWSEAKTDKYRAKWLSIYILLSIFPFLSVMFAFSIGVVNSRIEKRNISFWIGLFVFVYYGLVFKLSDIKPLEGTLFLVLFSFVFGWLVVNKKILKRY